jgi:arylsulfatase A-like enzyme
MLFRNSFHSARSGDLMLAYAPEYVEAYGERGISYGSLYSYETRVPVILFGRAFRPQVVEQASRLVDVAPTVAYLTSSPAPGAAVGRVLYEAFAPDPPPSPK